MRGAGRGVIAGLVVFAGLAAVVLALALGDLWALVAGVGGFAAAVGLFVIEVTPDPLENGDGPP